MDYGVHIIFKNRLFKLSSMSMFFKFSILAFSLSLLLMLLISRKISESGSLSPGGGIPGSFGTLGNLGGKGHYCYKGGFISERFAARVEGFSTEQFRDFTKIPIGSGVRTRAETELKSFERFVAQLSKECKIQLNDLELGISGSLGFGKHGLIRFFYSAEEEVMIVIGTKAF